MIDSFRRGARIGVGIATKTAQEVETSIEEFVRSKHLPGKKAKALAKELLKISKMERKRLMGNLRKNTKQRLKALHVVSRKEADKFFADMIALRYTFKDSLKEKSGSFKNQAKDVKDNLRQAAHKALHAGLETVLDHLLAEEEILEQKTRSALKKVKKTSKK